eukprot:Platyproteum_vivax@DN10322_c0_g1_i1.p1
MKVVDTLLFLLFGNALGLRINPLGETPVGEDGAAFGVSDAALAGFVQVGRQAVQEVIKCARGDEPWVEFEETFKKVIAIRRFLHSLPHSDRSVRMVAINSIDSAYASAAVQIEKTYNESRTGVELLHKLLYI